MTYQPRHAPCPNRECALPSGHEGEHRPARKPTAAVLVSGGVFGRYRLV